MRLSFFAALGLVVLLGFDKPAMSAEPLQFQSEITAIPLLEFYTSEGCSSCPPAEAWLSRLQDDPRLWMDFVPVAFHVDYWDHLGWKDPFATQAATQRQHAYASRWGTRSVYTPGFVFEGKEWRGWFNREELPGNLRKPVGVLTARSEGGRAWTVRFVPASSGMVSACDLHAALLGFDLSVAVKAGENRGRVLQHDFVVLALASAASRKEDGAFQGVLTLDPKLTVTPKRRAIAAWVTPARSVTPIQAVGGWLYTTIPAR